MIKKIASLLLGIAVSMIGSSLKAQRYASIAEILKLQWIDTTVNYNPYDDQRPLVKAGVVFPYNNFEYALDAISGNKVFYKDGRAYFQKLTKDSLLLFDAKKKASVLNIHTGQVEMEIPKQSSAYNGYMKPAFLHDSIIYIKTNKNELSAYEIFSGKKLWSFISENAIANQPVTFKNEIICCDKTTVYGLNKDTGEPIWKKNLGERITSGINLYDNMAFLWVSDQGLIALNVQIHDIFWKYENNGISHGNYNLLTQGDTIFFSNEHIYAINKNNGKLIWQSDEDCAIGSNYIASTMHFILYYEGCSEGEVDFVCAVNKNMGKKAYQGFTSDAFPPDNPNDPLNLAGIDYQKIRFVKNETNHMIFGISEGVIYAFRVQDSY